MSQIKKLDNLIVRILKEELEKKSLIKEKLGAPKKISDEEAVKILNNKNYDIETTIDYDYQYRDRAESIMYGKRDGVTVLSNGRNKLKADSFDNIEGEDTIRLSVYTPGKVDPFFLERDVKSRSWSMEEFEGNEISEEEKEFITSTGTGAGASADQKNKISELPAGTTVTYRKPGEKPKVTTEQKEQQLESVPTGTEIAGQVAEIVDKLKAMSEGSEDPKKQKLAEKIMKQMESAKAALEALTAHETMLAEKEEQNQLKLAEKNLKGVTKHLGKMVKERSIVEKIASKLDAKKIVELKKRLKKDLDEEGLAKTMLSYSLKEGWIK